MKKLFITLTALAAVLASCSKEAEQQAPETEDVKGPVTLNVILPETKTALGEKQGDLWPNYWSEGDKISVNGVTSEPLDAAGAGKATASFTVDGIAAPFYAAYPAASLSAYNAGNATITIPAAQSYVAGSYDPAAYVMLASGSETTLTFSSKVAIFKLTPTGEKSIKKIVLSSIGSDKIAGAFSTTDFSAITPAAGALTSLAVTADSPVPAGTPWFIVVPAVDYSVNGLRVRIEDAEGGSMTSSAKPSKAWEAGKMYSEDIPYAPVASDFTISAEGITSSTAVICLPDDSYAADALTFNVYSDADCSNLVNSFAVPAGDSCWGGAAPRFCISGLAPGVTYFVKVSNDTAHTESNSLSVTTAAFNIVEVSSNPAAVGDVILAEDFSELRWDSDLIGSGVGYFPTSQDSFANSEVGQFLPIDTNIERVLGAQSSALAASRLVHWAQGANNNLYIHPGYIKLVGSKKVTHIVTPALENIPDGKLATIEVEVTACPYYSESGGSFCTTNAIVAVQTGSLDELPNTNTLDLTTNKQDITLDAASAWKTFKVTLSNVVKGNRIAFGAAAGVSGNDARMLLSDMKVTVTALDDPAPAGITASVKAVSSSTAAFTWTYGGDLADDIAKPYTIALYSDSACSTLVVSFDIEADASCWNGRVPCFVFGGLNPSTEYWFVATDTEANLSSNPVSATTDAFTVVDATTVTGAAVGDVILAEDFSEIDVGPDEIARAAGFVPSSKVIPFGPSGVNPDGYYEKDIDGYSPFGERIFDAGWEIGSSRLSNSWGFFGNSSSYFGAGYLRFSNSSGRTHVVTPALSGIPAGKVATIEVTVTASKYETSTNDVAVFAESGLSMNSTSHKYTGASLSDGHALGLTAAKSWATKSVTINNVESDQHLLIGSLENDKNRFYISDVVVSIVSLKDKGAIDAEVNIQDFDTFKAFLEACEPGKTVKGNVLADIMLTSGQLEEIDALYPVAEFDGILNGNNHSIDGLTKPLFEEFSGSVSDLTLNSTLNITDAMNNIGILAESAENATISGCVTNGSIVLGCASEINGDISIGGMVGVNNGGTMTGCVNNASVTNNSSTNAGIKLGGLAGICHATLDSCSNTGNVTNNGTTYDDEINVAGVVAFCFGDLTSCHNEGAISNTATSGTNSIQDLQVGGVVANVKDPGYTLTSCFNTGRVSNSGAGNTNSVGGIAAWSTKGTFVTCYNEGDVENSGKASNTSATAPGARVAGLIASASGANTISGDADNYNYNNGEVYEHSASARAAVGGVCAWANNASTSLDYAQNLSGGVIWVEDGTYIHVYVGGVLGVETAAASFNYTKNAGKIGIRNITISKAAYIGGVHGGFTANGAQTITGCENTGEIDCPDSGEKSENMKSTSSANVVTYIGGISSGAGNDAARTSKTFNNCINRGAITMYNQCWTRLGGVVGYANLNPSGCENHGKIVYYRKSGGYSDQNGAVGGVIGYINIASVSDLTNTGGVQSTGSAPNCYTGGIVGQEGGNMKTMKNCNVGKSGINIVGAGSGSFASNGAGLFVATKTAKAWTFTGCKIITGTKCQSVVVDESNLADAVVGRNHATSITDAPAFVESF